MFISPQLSRSRPSGSGGHVGGGTARQPAIYSPIYGIGQIYINSGSTVRQTQLPGVAVTEGT
jgi:hypothetical protein